MKTVAYLPTCLAHFLQTATATVPPRRQKKVLSKVSLGEAPWPLEAIPISSFSLRAPGVYRERWCCLQLPSVYIGSIQLLSSFVSRVVGEPQGLAGTSRERDLENAGREPSLQVQSYGRVQGTCWRALL